MIYEPMPPIKQCKTCQRDLPLGEFPKNGKYRRGECRYCYAARYGRSVHPHYIEGQEYPCTGCGETKPFTREYFLYSSARGIRQPCKDCINRMSKDWVARNSERHKNSVSNWQNANPEKRKQISQDWQRDNPDRVKIKSRKWRQKYPDRMLASVNKWRQRHPDNARATVHRRRARKKSLLDQFTATDWQRAVSAFDGRCAYCDNPPGLLDFTKLSADHWIPLSDPNCPGTIPSNIVPACKSCNSSKRANPPETWLISRFGKVRATKITERIKGYLFSVDQIGV